MLQRRDVPLIVALCPGRTRGSTMGYYRSGRRAAQNYSVISNELLQQEGMSGTATAMVAYLLSKPEGWRGLPSDIEKRFNIGTTARRSATVEAEKFGYLKFVSARNELGHFDQFYEAYDKPIPPEERSKSWEYRKPTPGSPGPVPTPDNQGSENLRPEKGGSLISKDQESKEIESKERIGPPAFLTREQLQERTGQQVTQEDSEQAQEYLFLTSGKVYCVNRFPTCLAFIQNLKRTRGADAALKILQALREPERHGISRTWATWELEEALWPTDKRNGRPVINTPDRDRAIIEAAKKKIIQYRSQGESNDRYIASMLHQFPAALAQKAFQELEAVP